MADEVKIEISAIDKTAAAVNQVKKNLTGLESAAKSTSSALKGLGQGLLMGAGMAGFNALAGIPGTIMSIGGAALDSYAKFERLSMSLNALSAKEALQSGTATSMAQAMAQTSGKAKELVDWVQKLAIESPFGQEDVAATFRMSMAMGFTTKEAQRTTQALLDFSAATGSGSDKMVQLGQALGEIKTTGKISGEEIRQLSEAGLNATQILADAFGQTPKQIAENISKGKVDADTALNALLGSIEKFYAGAGKAQANSISGLMNSLGDIQDITGRNLFSGVFKAIQPQLADMTSALSAPEFQAAVTELGDKLGGMVGDGINTTAAAIERAAKAVESGPKEVPAWILAVEGMNNEKPGTSWLSEMNKQAEGIYSTIQNIDRTTAAWGDNMDIAGKLGLNDLDNRIGEIFKGPFDIKVQYENGNLIQLAGDLAGLFSVSNPFFVPLAIDAGVAQALYDQAGQPFKEPIMMFGSWANGVLDTLWNQVKGFFSGKTVTVGVIQTAAPVYGPNMKPLGIGANDKMPIDVNQPPPYTSEWDILHPKGKATGGNVHGWAMVGETGPELAYFGANGGHVISAKDTRMLGGKLPGYADGSVKVDWPAFLQSIGMWKSSASAMGPKSLADTGWKEMQTKTVTAMQGAAKQAGDAFETAAKKTSETFKDVLSSIPGIGGLSPVTDLDMKKAAAGMSVNYADDYIRQLSDEVLNGKDHGANIDIKDAAKRAGIDPSLPNDIILELVKQAWSDKSFFANPANLGLINQDAIKQDMEAKQKAAEGSANLLSFFGLDNTAESKQASALGAAIAAQFGAIPPEQLKGAGATMMSALSAGFSDPAAAGAAVTGISGAVTAAAGTAEGAAALSGAGGVAAASYYAGWKTFMESAPPVAPSGTGTMGPVTAPPGKAVGVGNWQGGWARVHKDETIYLPQGASVRTARESARAQGGAMGPINVTVMSPLDVEQTVNQIVRRLRQRAN